jgi:hypothetical protein
VQPRHFTGEKIRGHSRLLAAGLLLSAGGLLWMLSAAGRYPMREVAARFSDDGILSDVYARLIQDSQLKLSFSFLLAGSLLSWIDAPGVVRRLRSLAFWKVAAAAGLLALLLGYAVQEWMFEGIPHVTDATSHLFQAKIFASGRMYAPAPECPEAFWQPHVVMTRSGKWFTKYTPGHSLLLAGGMALGLLKWTLPLCWLATLVALGKFLDRHEGRACAGMGMFLLALSPLALLLSGSYMSHVSAMAFTALGIFCWVRGQEGGSPWKSRIWAGAGGFLLAASALARPHEFVLFGLVGLLFSLSFDAGEWRRLFRSLPWLILGAVPVLGFWAFWNATLYGNPFAAGYGFTQGDALRPAFQGHWGLSPAYGWRKALALLVWNLDRVNGSFFGWPCSLLFVPFAFIRRGGRLLYLSVLGAAVGMGFYFFYDYHAELESRYYFLVLPFFAYLTLRGIRNLVGFWNSPAWREFAAQGIFLLVSSFYLYAALYYWPGYLLPKYGCGYEESSPRVEQAVRQRGLNHAVVLIAPDDGASFFYSSGFIYNDPLLAGNVIYARHVGGAADCLRKAYPNRAFYVFDRTKTPGDGLARLD